jgi:hypothetical protein
MLCLCFLILFVEISHAQDKEFIYEGSLLLKDKTSIKYKINFNTNEKKKTINGYSITDEKGPNETKALLKGTFGNNIITINEYEIVSTKTKAKDVSFCYVNAVMNLISISADKQLNGKFIGKLYPKNEICATGTIQLKKIEPVVKLNPIITKPIEKITPKEEKLDIKQFTILNNNNSYTWTSDTATIEIWDQGNQDGDIVSIFVDGQLLKSNILLTSNKMLFKIPISKKGEHSISIRAENEGKFSPNTGSLILYDKNKKYMLYCESKQFEMKSIKIIR